MSTFIEKELKDLDDPAEPRFHKRKTWRSIFCTKLAKGIIIALSIALLVPTLAYFFVISRNVPDAGDEDQYYCLIVKEFRIPCGNVGIKQDACEAVNCCFNTTTNECHHFLPSKFFYKKNENTFKASQNKSPVGSVTLPNIKLTTQHKSANKLSFIIHDPSENVEEVLLKNTNFAVILSTKKLSLEVLDQDENIVFSSTKAALIASERYWEWGFELTNGTLFGLDRNRIELQEGENITKVIYKNRNDHYTMPVLWAYQDGKFHGVIIRHEGPLEIQILSSNMIILRSLVGKKIEVELSLGPTPIELYNTQIQKVIPPPLWMLGTHNCRKGNSINLKEILKIYAENNTSNFDTDCIHENLFMALQDDFVDEDIAALKEVIKTLSENGKKFLFALPPHILVSNVNQLYVKASELGILYKNQKGVIYNGTYLSRTVVYPDFSITSIGDYINFLMEWLDNTIGRSSISGFVLNDNWPQDDSYQKVLRKDLPYFSEAFNEQMKYTLPWNLQGSDKVLHLEKHNLYGEYQNSSLYKYAPDSLIVSAAKQYGSSEPEISDNFATSWENFNMYLNKILFSSISGNPMIGLPICGDTSNYNKSLHEILCMRWYMAAVTMPYFRVSSGNIFRDPANLNTKYAEIVAETAMTRRARLQDYLFTLLSTSSPVVRPMYFDYYANDSTLSMERQYTLGSNIIVTHPFSSGATRLQVYLPYSKGVWYEFWGGTKFAIKKSHEFVEIDLIESDLIMFVAQGTIVALTSITDLQLYIGLDCTSGSCKAKGELLKEDRLLKFSASDSELIVEGLSTKDCHLSLTNLRVYGYNSVESYVKIFKVDSKTLCEKGKEKVTIVFKDLQ
ncbi:lysosomal alpha-glucosidase-like [Euwallacea fornicatus]|uniref:lysosomal alpha-glucosidase-like n=1 Tax=Euwallacea fornicatus TaxID=995702 RepID=UPI0033900DD8